MLRFGMQGDRGPLDFSQKSREGILGSQGQQEGAPVQEALQGIQEGDQARPRGGAVGMGINAQVKFITAVKHIRNNGKNTKEIAGIPRCNCGYYPVYIDVFILYG